MTFIQSYMGGNYDSVKNATRRLEEEGLVTWTEIPGKSRYIMIELTQLGRDVAVDLKRANDRLMGFIPESDQPNHGASETEGSEVKS